MSDIKITPLMLRLLKILMDNPDYEQFYGLAISKVLGKPYGSVLPILIKLENFGWLKTDLEDIDPSIEGRPKRKYYYLTTKGKANANELLEKEKSFWNNPIPIPSTQS